VCLSSYVLERVCMCVCGWKKVWDVAKNIRESDARDSEKERACNVAKTHLLCKADVYKEKNLWKQLKIQLAECLICKSVL